jgi:hypothetical protein
MKNLTLTAAIVAATFGSAALADSYYLPSSLQKGLIEVCKTAAKDQNYRMDSKIKEYRLKYKTVALNVMCNGEDIISFAEGYGAVKTTARLSESIGSVSVTDLAAIRTYQYDVNFIMD